MMIYICVLNEQKTVLAIIYVGESTPINVETKRTNSMTVVYVNPFDAFGHNNLLPMLCRHRLHSVSIIVCAPFLYQEVFRYWMVVTGVLGGDGRRPSMHVDVGESGGSISSSFVVLLLSAVITLGDMGGEDGCGIDGASLRRHCSEQ